MSEVFESLRPLQKHCNHIFLIGGKIDTVIKAEEEVKKLYMDDFVILIPYCNYKQKIYLTFIKIFK